MKKETGVQFCFVDKKAELIQSPESQQQASVTHVMFKER